MSTSNLTRSLRAYRGRNFLTQAELAEILGVHERSIQDYEAGTGRVPRAAVLRRIADLLAKEKEAKAA